MGCKTVLMDKEKEKHAVDFTEDILNGQAYTDKNI